MMGSQGLVTVASLVLIGLITVNLSLGLETTSVGKRKGRLCKNAKHLCLCPGNSRLKTFVLLFSPSLSDCHVSTWSFLNTSESSLCFWRNDRVHATTHFHTFSSVALQRRWLVIELRINFPKERPSSLLSACHLEHPPMCTLFWTGSLMTLAPATPAGTAPATRPKNVPAAAEPPRVPVPCPSASAVSVSLTEEPFASPCLSQ